MVPAYTDMYQVRCTAHKVAPEDGLIQSETCRACNRNKILITRILCILLVHIRTVHIHSYSHRLSQFAESLHHLHSVISYDIVTVGCIVLLSLVAKRGAMNTFDLEGRIVACCGMLFRTWSCV